MCPQNFSLRFPQQKNCCVRFFGTDSKRARCSQSSNRPRRPLAGNCCAAIKAVSPQPERHLAPARQHGGPSALRQMLGCVEEAEHSERQRANSRGGFAHSNVYCVYSSRSPAVILKLLEWRWQWAKWPHWNLASPSTSPGTKKLTRRLAGIKLCF